MRLQGQTSDKGQTCQGWRGKGYWPLHSILPHLDLFYQGLPIDILTGRTGPRMASSKRVFLQELWTESSSIGSTSILLCVFAKSLPLCI